MKTCKECKIDKELSEYSKRSASKDGLKFICKVCEKIKCVVYYQNNKEKCLATSKSWKEVNKNKVKEDHKIYYNKNKNEYLIKTREYKSKNKEKVKEIKKKWYQENKENVHIYKEKWFKDNIDYDKKYYIENKEQINTRIKEYVNNNREKINAYTSKRRATKLQRTPKWLTKDHFKEIESFYKLSKELEKLDGIKRHVDHIIPLQGQTVSGLHVPWNLRVITESENCSKGNKLIQGVL